MIEYFEHQRNGSSKKISMPKKGCWVKAINPSEEEIKILVHNFGISKDNLDDGLDIYENPRMEEQDGKVYLFLSSPTSKISQEHIGSFLVVNSRDFLFVISKYDLEIFEKLEEMKIKNLGQNFFSQLVVRILFLISRLFETSVRKILKEVKTDRANFGKLDERDIGNLINHEDKLNSYITPFETIVDNHYRILKNKSFNFTEKNREMLEDLIIDMSQGLGLCKQTLKTISNMRTYFSTQLSNDLNRKVNLLTIFTIFLAIPTLISSIYGMNIHLPFQTNLALVYYLGALVVLAWGVLFYFLKHYDIW